MAQSANKGGGSLFGWSGKQSGHGVGGPASPTQGSGSSGSSQRGDPGGASATGSFSEGGGYRTKVGDAGSKKGAGRYASAESALRVGPSPTSAEPSLTLRDTAIIDSPDRAAKPEGPPWVYALGLYVGEESRAAQVFRSFFGRIDRASNDVVYFAIPGDPQHSGPVAVSQHSDALAELTARDSAELRAATDGFTTSGLNHLLGLTAHDVCRRLGVTDQELPCIAMLTWPHAGAMARLSIDPAWIETDGSAAVFADVVIRWMGSEHVRQLCEGASSTGELTNALRREVRAVATRLSPAVTNTARYWTQVTKPAPTASETDHYLATYMITDDGKLAVRFEDGETPVGEFELSPSKQMTLLWQLLAAAPAPVQVSTIIHDVYPESATELADGRTDYTRLVGRVRSLVAALRGVLEKADLDRNLIAYDSISSAELGQVWLAIRGAEEVVSP